MTSEFKAMRQAYVDEADRLGRLAGSQYHGKWVKVYLKQQKEVLAALLKLDIAYVEAAAKAAVGGAS